MDVQQHRARLQRLESLQSGWRETWRRIAEQVRPRSVRWVASERQTAGQDKQAAIINSTPAIASRTAAAGLMSGITSPSRPWFRLSVSDRELAELDSVKEYLERVREEILEAFAKSNVYAVLQQTYEDLVDYGTALMQVDEDAEDVLRAYSFPLGSYFLEASERMAVDTYYRRTMLTVRQVVRRFGLDAVSDTVRLAHKNSQYEDLVEVAQCVYPADDARPKGADPRLVPEARPFRCVWWEVSATDPQKPLKEETFQERPFMAPRWQTTGEDVYGSSPGMVAVGDCEALQTLERRAAQMFELIVTPPLVAPASLRQKRVRALPGVVTYLDSVGPNDTVRPMHDVNPQAPAVAANQIAVHEARIRAAYYADLWLLLSQSEGTMTAREVMERREEKMLQLGSVLEKLQDELLEPLITRAYGVLLRAGRLPPPPRELAETKEFKVEYLSLMAQAQKVLGLTGVDRFAGFVASLSQHVPQALDKLDGDAIVESYADMAGVPPQLLRGAEDVEKLRAERAKQQQRAQAVAQAPEAAKTAKTLADTEVAGSNALEEMLRGMGAR